MSEVRGHALASSRRTSPFSAVLMLAGLFAVLLLPGCDRAGRPMAPVTTPPVADSPAHAVRVLEWSFANRDPEVLEGLFADDLAYVTAAVDSTDAVEVWDRSRLLNSIVVFFRGDPTGPAPASKLSLVFDQSLRAQPDPRPGRAADVHQAIRTAVDFKVVHADEGVSEVTGHVLFYLTRGDSAEVPLELMTRLAHSSSRWWISRIEDETLPSGGLAPNPAGATSLSDVLRRYWNPR